jgi:hypothetical protein
VQNKQHKEQSTDKSLALYIMMHTRNLTVTARALCAEQ